jgi:ProP effector
MGFEQLAKLRDQLSKSAKTKAPARADRNRTPAAVSKGKPAADARPDNRANVRPNAKSANPVSKAAPRPKPPVNAKPVDPVVVHIGRLQKRFPEAFPKNPAPKVPLKIGIFEDLIPHIAELKLTQPELRDAIKVWCRGSRYWSAMSADAIRVDLSGAEAGRVSPEDAVRAQKLEEARLARVAAKAQTAAPAAPTEPAPAAAASEPSES